MSAVRAALACAILVSFATAGSAKSLRDVDGPAETPPGTYAESQYVDSKGCVFIRAGYGGQVTWVPRVSSSRQLLCGYKPSIPGYRGEAAPVRVTSAPAPQPAVQPAPVVREVAAAPAAAPATRPAPNLVSVPVAQVFPAAPARTTIASAPSSAVVPTPPPAATFAAACRGASVLSSRYVGDGNRYAVRCGPQSVHPATEVLIRVETVPLSQVATYRVVQVPQSLDASASGYAAAAPVEYIRPLPVTVPSGYRTAYDAGRLNPHRGVGTALGQARMNLVWTETVPRRLVNDANGELAVGQGCTLRYPHTDCAQQAQAGRVTMTSKSTPEAAPTRRAAAPVATGVAGSYVQVGTFGDPANAAQLKARFAAQGIAAQTRPLVRGGKSYQVVVIGPFADAGQGVATARRAGFADAFVLR